MRVIFYAIKFFMYYMLLLVLLAMMSNPIALIAMIIMVIVYVKNNVEYKNSSYYSITHNSYLAMKSDIGKYGEYLTYKNLKKYEKTGAKFLFNAYIPKGNDGTTEIDVLMISRDGIFVFESKNYSGWIFGSENQKNWYQTLPVGRGRSQKEHFYNPVMQNRTHIKHLKNLVGEHIPMISIIAFSDRCKLMSIELKSNDVTVINRRYVNAVVNGICNQNCELILNDEQINEIYNRIYPYTQVNEAVKVQHVANINKGCKTTVDMTVTENEVDNLSNNTNGINEADVKINNESLKNVCPKCGAELILRTARRGMNAGNQFYGCSNYPRCKYIQDVT